jgi:urease accessory protein
MLEPLETEMTPTTAPTWQADIAIRLSHSKYGTRLSHCQHRGPLYIQKPFYPEGKHHAHLYLLHPPAGIVSGDTLTMNLHVDPNAAALMTTPGATVVYKARESNPTQRQIINLHIANNATLEWLPLETIVHNHACFEATPIINMVSSSHFFGWEITSLGLPASDQRFTNGSFKQRYQIVVDGKNEFIDQMKIDDSNRHILLASKAGMQNRMISGFCVFGPVATGNRSEGRHSDDQLERLRQQQLEQQAQSNTDRNSDYQSSITRLGNFYVGRYLGGSAEQARKQFTLWWSVARQEMLGKEACTPRIWAN